MRFSAKVAISVIFSSSFIISFDWNENFEFRWSSSDLSVYTVFQFIRIFFYLQKINFNGKKWKVIEFFVIPMIVSEKSHQNLSDCNQFILRKNDLKFIKKNRFFLAKKSEIQVIEFMIMLNHSSERIFNPSHYIGVVDLLRRKEDVIEIIVNNLIYSSIS